MLTEIQNFIARRIPSGIMSAQHIEAEVPRGGHDAYLMSAITEGRLHAQIAKARIVLPSEGTRHREALLVRRRRRRMRLANRY